MNTSPVFPGLAASRNATDSSALEHLAATVGRLVRAERQQTLTHYGLAGLFWGFAAASVAVVAIRLALLPVSTAHATFSCIAIGLAIGLATGWLNRRSPMAVAILADIRLNLQQRLSSAWELYEKDRQSVIAAGISRQLHKNRTPVAHHVFPLSAKSGNAQYIHPGVRWGRLLPAVALLLLLLSTLNFEHVAGQRGSQVDSAVQREGKTLRSYSTSMALRAHEQNLAASAQMADSMRQLGRRMEGGTLARGPALERLNELRSDINNGRQRLLPRNGKASAVSESDYSRARSVIENAASELANGATSPGELRDNTSLERALVTANLNPDAFRRALEDAHNGDPESLEKMLDELRNGERAARDAQELERAYERVQSIRENLGAQAEPESTAPSGQARGSHTDDDFADEHAASSHDEYSESPGFVFQDHGRPGGRASAPDRNQNSAPKAVPESDQPTVQPKGTIGEGREIATQMRITPTQGEVTTAIQISDLQQQQQLEAILSKDTLPAHQKAYVRRYFLELSRAVAATPVNTLPAEPSP